MKNIVVLLFATVLFIYTNKIQGQELEPGFLSTMPIGGNIALASYSYSAGEVVLDNSLPIEDSDGRVNLFVGGFVRSFKFLNRMSKFDIVIPYAIGNFNGLVESEEKSTSRSGFGDPMVSFSMILLGTKPLKPKEYFNYEHKKFKLGLSFRLKVPLGQYDPDKLINLGANRWALRTSVAGSYTIKEKIVLEGHVTSWFFGENDDFFGGFTSKQEPLIGAQVHVTYIFKPGTWLAASIGGTKGGVINVDGVERPPQNNNRYGVAFAYKVSKSNSLKLTFTNNLITTFGGDYNTLLFAFQHIWFDKK